MNTFFTADTHYSHPNIIRYCNRPFLKPGDLDMNGHWVSEAIAWERTAWMDETLIQNWNAKVKQGDRVYHLGDFGFGQRDKILALTRRLNGHIILIEGNHDEIGSPGNYGFSGKHQLLSIKLNGAHITLCHFAMRVWEKSHFDSWHCYGHSHGTLDPIGKAWDVGVDKNAYEPIEFEELKKIMEAQPHNFNWLERLPGYNKKEYEEAKQTEMT